MGGIGLAPVAVWLTLFSPSLSALDIICHRGGGWGAPENTLVALEMGLERGCDWLEVDVRITRDGRPVLLHDASLNRTTTGSGRISDRTYRQIAKLDAGVSFGRRFQGAKVPLLEEAIELARGRAHLYLDVKVHTPDPVVHVVGDAGASDFVVYRVYTLRVAERIAGLDSNARIILNLRLLRHLDRLEKWPLPPGRVYFNAPLDHWGKRDSEQVRTRGAQILVEQLGRELREEQVRLALELGACALQTDMPVRLRTLLEGLR